MPGVPRWTEPNGFDTTVRNAIRAKTPAGRSDAAHVSDLMLTILVNHRLVDDLFVTWWGYGAGSVAFQMTLDWAFDRYTFGRALASYQALKHRFANDKMWFEAARATTASAVAAVADRSPDAPKLVSIAKAYVAERTPVILQDCVQLHGGIGVTWEHDLHLFLRRTALYRAMFGAPEDHYRIVYALSRKQEDVHA